MRGWVLGSIVLAACGAGTALAPTAEPAPRPVVDPAPRYFLVGDVHEISEGSSVREGTALVVRAGQLESEREYGEPWFEALDALASAITERVYGGSYEREDETMDELVREACASGEQIPRELRVGSSVDVLGAGGWERASITGCTGYAFGHYFYFAFFVDRAPEGAVLATIGGGPRAAGTYSALPEVLPSPSEEARSSLREQLARLGLAGAFISARPENVGSFELPDGRALVHVGVPPGDAEEGDRVGREVCWTYGSCVATAILAFDGPSGEARIVHGSSDEEVSAELDGVEGGAWNVLGVFRDGSAVGIVSSYENIGERVVVVTRWRDGEREQQTLYNFQSG